MLEHPHLLLLPPAADGARAILDAETRRRLGRAAWRPPRGGWLRHWGVRELEVREEEDEPLVFTVRRNWTPWTSQEVRDAEGGRVGRVRRPYLLDRSAVCFAVRRPQAGGVVYRTPGGVELAVARPQAGGCGLTFLPAVRGDPLAKMVLLAGALLE